MNPFQPAPRVPDVEQIDVASVATLLEGDDAPFLLDVREPEEWNEAHIPQATLIPLGQLGARQAEIPTDREIICICRSGMRSAFATEALDRAGYRARNMAGGMLAWSRQGLPTE